MKSAIALFCVVICASTAWSQTASERSLEETYALVREFAEAERDALLEEELDLSAREAERFWPVYEAYRADVGEVMDRYGELISLFAANYDNLSDPLARQMLADYFSIQSNLLDVRRRYLPIFLGAIPAAKLARFYQAENKIDTIGGLELVVEIPLAGDSR